MKQLTRFTITYGDDDQFLLQLTDGDGQVAEYAASAEQIDAVIEALDDLLSEFEEDVFEVELPPADHGRPPRTS